MPLLSVSGLEVRYGAVAAVKGIDLHVDQGELVALLGANGAGKSSTLNAIISLAPVSAGRVAFSGQDISHLATEYLVRRGITLCPEGRRVFAGLTVAENLRLGAYGQQDKNTLCAAYRQVHDLFPVLKDRQEQIAGTLSGGQQQMLAIARALMSRPKMLLLDEPSLGLAPRIVETIFELVATLREQGITLLLVEQNVALSLSIIDRAYVMAGGKIVASGTARELRESHLVERAYLGAN